MKGIEGCLVIHGFGGGTHEVEPLADYLSDTGYIVACPKLKGHTGNSKDMRRANYKDWITSAEEEFLLLMEKVDKITIVGFSMGGLIAVNLACKYKVEAIVTINTPIYYWDLKRVFINVIEDFKSRKFKNIKRYIHAKKVCPFISMINFLIILYTTKAKLSSIDCPFLIIQTKDDDTSRLKSADYIYNNIKSENKKIKLYEKGGHIVLLSSYKDQIIKDVEKNLKSLQNK